MGTPPPFSPKDPPGVAGLWLCPPTPALHREALAEPGGGCLGVLGSPSSLRPPPNSQLHSLSPGPPGGETEARAVRSRGPRSPGTGGPVGSLSRTGGGGWGQPGCTGWGGGNVPTATLPMCLSFPPQEPSLEGEGGSPKNSGLRVWVRVGRGVSGFPPSPPPQDSRGGGAGGLVQPLCLVGAGGAPKQPPQVQGGGACPIQAAVEKGRAKGIPAPPTP